MLFSFAHAILQVANFSSYQKHGTYRIDVSPDSKWVDIGRVHHQQHPVVAFMDRLKMFSFLKFLPYLIVENFNFSRAYQVE